MATTEPSLGYGVEPAEDLERLRLNFPNESTMRVSHEAIYQALWVQGRGALKRELTACLRTGGVLRVPRARPRGRGTSSATPEILISERAAEVEDRAVSGHGKGDLIIGLNRSAIGTLVERTTRFTMLLHLPPMPGRGIGPREKKALHWRGMAPKRCATRSRERSRPCRCSCAVRRPGTGERKWPSTRGCKRVEHQTSLEVAGERPADDPA
jgi:hypothetical protein